VINCRACCGDAECICRRVEGGKLVGYDVVRREECSSSKTRHSDWFLINMLLGMSRGLWPIFDLDRQEYISKTNI